MIKQSLRLLALAALTLLLPALTRAQTVINSLPYTISTPGDYVLGGNLSYNAASGNAITFAVGNVTLEFNGHFISGLGAGSGTNAIGLRGTDRANITIQNGAVVGFLYGIYFDGGSNNTGNVITNMRLPSNTDAGIYLTNPVTCRVENCQVNKTGGTTALGANSDTYGIRVSGGSVLVKNNQVSTITPVGTGTGNGIYCSNSLSHFVVGNQIDNCGLGLRMNSAQGNKYQNNLTASCTTPFSGGQDAGGNN